MLDRCFMLLEYLRNVFGNNNVCDYNLDTSLLPLYLRGEYRFCGFCIGKQPYVFVLPNNTLNLKSYKVQKKKLETILALPIVLCAERLIFQQRENLINSGMEFVEPNKQIFMPSIGTILDNRQKRRAVRLVEKFTPQIQLCALFFFYQKEKEYTSNEISEITGLNVMAISRGLSALNQLDLLSVRKAARTNYYAIKTTKPNYISTIKDYLISPIQKVLYASESDLKSISVKAGYTALEQMTSIVDDSVKTCAISKNAYKTIEDRCRQSLDEFLLSEKVVKVEVWKYDPMIFKNNDCVDKLSLYLSFENENDERTNEALNELMKEIKNG